MGLCLGKTTAWPLPCWPNLPPEIVGVILSCLASEDDRLSIAAVCREWRLATLQQRPTLPPAMPCISLGNGAYQSIADGKVRRTRGRRAVSFGSWLMYEQQDGHGHGRIYMCDPSLSVIEVPGYYHRCSASCHDGVAHDPRTTAEARCMIYPRIASNIHKVIVCLPHLVAAIVDPSTGRPDHDTAHSFAFFRPCGTSQLSWALCTSPEYRYQDMVLYGGKIFALSFSNQLYAHELGQPCHAEHIIMEWPPPQPPGIYPPDYMLLVKHLVVSSDGRKLLMVRWNIPQGDCIHRTRMYLQVLEADLEKREWLKVEDLDGQVLFLSKTCSRALAGSSTKLYDPRFREGNRVFILGFDWARRFNPCTCSDCDKYVHAVPSYCVYDMMSRRLSLVSLGGRGHRMRNLRSEWFFPSG